MHAKSHSSWSFEVKPHHLWIGAGILLHLLISINMPMTLMVDSNYDDQLYMKLAAYMLAGDWLGPYDGQTLQKGIGAPLFMAIIAALGVPFRIAQSLAFSFSLTFVATALRRLGATRLLVWGSWSLALFCPNYWETGNLRPARDQLLSTLVLWMLGLGLWMLHRQKDGVRRYWLWGLASGLLWGWVWNTREESPWTVLPMVFLGILSFIYAPSSPSRADFKTRFMQGARGWSGFACMLLGLFLFFTWNKSMNYRKYGIYETIEVWAPELGAAYGALARVKPKHELPTFIPVLKSNIPKIRAVSPTFDKVMERFSTDLDKYPGFTDSRKNEYTNGWLFSGMKTAAFDAGLTPTARDAKRVWLQLAQEVNTACDTGKLECGSWHPSLVPPITPAVVWEAFKLGTKNWLRIIDFSWFTYTLFPSRGSIYLQDFFTDMFNVPVVPSPDREVLRVGLGLKEKPQSLGIETDELRRDVLLLPLGEKDTATGHWARAEVHFSRECTHCALLVQTRDKLLRLPLLQIMNGNPVVEGIPVSLEHRFSGASKKFMPGVARASLLFKALTIYNKVFQYIFYAWTLIALFYFFRMLPRNKHAFVFLLFPLIPLVGIYGRLGIMALTEVTSFPTTTPLYLTPVFALLMLWPAFIVPWSVAKITRKKP